MNNIAYCFTFILLVLLSFNACNAGPNEEKRRRVMTTEEKKELKTRLTPLQYKVTQENGTERAFQNEFWDNKEKGIYVDIISGEPLFSSIDKFESGTGWPSFTKPIVSKNVIEEKDSTFGMTRVEVRSNKGDSHLGHLFPDGPAPEGNRYCINSASLRFIEVENLEKEGYKEFKDLFISSVNQDAKK